MNMTKLTATGLMIGCAIIFNCSAPAQTVFTKKDIAALRFSHPRDINNPYLPFGPLKQDILIGKEGGQTLRVERTTKPDVHKTFKIGKQTVEALAVEDREFDGNGELTEVT